MKITRTRALVRVFSPLTVGIVLLSAWQGTASANDEPPVDVPETGTVTTEAAGTVDSVADEVAETTTEVTTTIEEVADTPDAPDTPEAVDEAVDTVETTASAVVNDETTETGGNQETGSGGSTSSEPAPTTTASTTDTDRPSTGTSSVQAAVTEPRVDNTMFMATRMKLRPPTKKILNRSISAGDDVEGTVLLGERIKSTSSRVEPEPSEPTTSGELALTGADLVPFVLLAAALLVLGSRAAAAKRPVERRRVHVTSVEVTHLRFV